MQTYFYGGDGRPIVGATGPNKQYAHFFGDEAGLAKQIENVLWKAMADRYYSSEPRTISQNAHWKALVQAHTIGQ